MEVGELSKYILPKDEELRQLKYLEEEMKNYEEIFSIYSKIDADEKTRLASYPTISSFFEDLKLCHKCKGLSHCKKAPGLKGLQKKLYKKDYSPFLDSSFHRCEYYKKVSKILENFIYSDVELMDVYLTYAKISSSLREDSSSKVKSSFNYISKKIFLDLKNVSKDKSNPSFYLSSTNKNAYFLALTLSFFLARQNYKVSIVSSRTLSSSTSKIDEEKKEALTNLDKASKGDVLVLLDLGQEYPSFELVNRTLVDLISSYNQEGKLVIISSLSEKDELLSYYFHSRSSSSLLIKLLNEMFNEYTISDLER